MPLLFYIDIKLFKETLNIETKGMCSVKFEGKEKRCKGSYAKFCLHSSKNYYASFRVRNVNTLLRLVNKFTFVNCILKFHQV